LPSSPKIRFAVGFTIGIGIGIIGSMLGVAGGELLIPTLIFIFARRLEGGFGKHPYLAWRRARGDLAPAWVWTYPAIR
jgi:uncharacterized membrane protein YfcA